jgi:small subunit ribosomal protein S16
MLALKLQRIGKKHQGSYRVVVARKRSRPVSPPVEDVGFYNPAQKSFNVKSERVTYWLGVGAHPTATVHNLLVKHGIVKGKAVPIRMRRKTQEEIPAATPETGATAPSAA